jgi:hypothetical protein
VPAWHENADPVPAWHENADPVPAWHENADPVPAWHENADPLPAWHENADPVPAWHENAYLGGAKDRQLALAPTAGRDENAEMEEGAKETGSYYFLWQALHFLGPFFIFLWHPMHCL